MSDHNKDTASKSSWLYKSIASLITPSPRVTDELEKNRALLIAGILLVSILMGVLIIAIVG